MKKRKLIFKPLDNVQLCYLMMGAFVLLILNIGPILTGDIFDFQEYWPVLIFDVLPFLGYILARIVFGGKYVVDDMYMTKYIKRAPVLKVKTSDIEKVFIRRGKWYYYFTAATRLLFWQEPDEEKLTNISFIFKRCEFVDRKQDQKSMKPLKTKEYEDYAEWYDCYSLKKAKKLCKRLGITPTYVK